MKALELMTSASDLLYCQDIIGTLPVSDDTFHESIFILRDLLTLGMPEPAISPDGFGGIDFYWMDGASFFVNFISGKVPYYYWVVGATTVDGPLDTYAKMKAAVSSYLESRMSSD